MADTTLDEVTDNEDLLLKHKTGKLTTQEAIELGLLDEEGYDYSETGAIETSLVGVTK